MIKKNAQKVFVAMSGGVDSSVAAVILKKQGYEVIGVTMCFGVPSPSGEKPSCCGAQGITDAKAVSDKLNIPHYVLDFAQDLEECVVRDFINEYRNARTPNPCVRCNQLIKFGSLLKKIKALGGDYLATGHYARLIKDRSSGAFQLKKAADAKKDQSYFLYAIEKQKLASLLFPLGAMDKEAVRALARQHNLLVAEKKESQDICFVSQEGYQKFIERRTGEKAFAPGDFIDEKGQVVGRHKGVINYTIGQRDKLGIALGRRVYVNRIDQKTNTVYVGAKDLLISDGLYAAHANFFMEKSKEIIEASVRIRYNAKEVRASFQCLPGKRVKVIFKEPQLSVTPGQSVVFYDKDVVLGGAIIERPFKNIN